MLQPSAGTKRETGGVAGAREHQAELDRRAREDEHDAEDRRRLQEEVKDLVFDLRTLSGELTNWRDREAIDAAKEKWTNHLRSRVHKLSLAPVAGESKVQKLALRLLYDYEDLVAHAYLLPRQGPGHPHGKYTQERYGLAQGEARFLTLKLIEAIGGKAAPTREESGETLLHEDDERDERDFAD